MTRQLSLRQAVWLGVAVFLGLGLAAWVVFRVDERRGLGNDAFSVEASFIDIGGVEVGTRVRIQGINAGEVVAITAPDKPGEPVKLRMLLTGKLRHLVTADARVQIANENLLTGKFVRILPGSGGPVADGAALASISSAEMSDAIAQLNVAATDANKGKGTLGMFLKDDTVARDVAQSMAKLNKALTRLNSMVEDVDQGKGTLGLFLRDPTLYNELLGTLVEVKSALGQDVRRLVVSVKQNSDAIKSLPLVRSYVVDAHKELVRPECQRFCKWFPESDLFEPGRAMLTDKGRKNLDEAAAWVKNHKEIGSEVIIASFASANQNSDVALTLTQKQSEAVCEYLRNAHKVHRTGWWWWSTRSVRPIGVGTNHPAIPESASLPGSRIELLVFVPGK